MLINDHCNLHCDIPECNYDNGNCGGYLHVEFVGAWDTIDPAAHGVVSDVVRKLNSAIKVCVMCVCVPLLSVVVPCECIGEGRVK
jgi:hypothetical protein